MGSKPRPKGKNAELEVVRIFNEAGLSCRRTGTAGQIDGDIDFEGLELYAEIRRREVLSIPAWLREIEREAPEGRDRALIFRRSHEPWHVAMPLDQFIRLVKEAR